MCHAFVADPSGRLREPAVDGVLETRNVLKRYAGLGHRPSPFAAKIAGKAVSAASPERGEDGEIWVPVAVPP